MTSARSLRPSSIFFDLRQLVIVEREIILNPQALFLFAHAVDPRG
jgi:hypothetical protein